MKRFLFGFLAILFLILNTIPYLHIMADSSMTDSQYRQVGAFALSSLITTGEATELDFNDYTSSDTDFLLALGELVVTGDPTGLFECGLEWLGGTIDDAYDSAIQSIRTWEYNNLPDSFYYWFIDENPPYELTPSYTNIRDLSQPLRRLLTPPDNGPDADLPSDYSFLNNINQLYIKDYFYDIVNFYSFSEFANNRTGQPFYPMDYSSCSFTGEFVSDNFNAHSGLGVNSITSYGITYNTPNIVISIDSSDPNNVLVSYSSFGHSGFGHDGYNTHYFYCTDDNGVLRGYYLNGGDSVLYYTQTSFVGINSALNYIYQHYSNINLVVNGDLWIRGNGNFNYPIIIPDQLTIWNNQPLQYEFPSDTYLKLPDLTNIITNAINNSGVVMWSDIADCFVDINGQTVVAVTKIVRNDYDNLYMEQYPYPAMLLGMTDQTKFNEHLLDDSHAYLSPMGTVVQETVNVLPPELVGVLAIGAILTIFAVIINRLLE